MRPAWLYGAGAVVLVLLTVLIFGVDMPAAVSVTVQVVWIALIFVLCLMGARDIRRSKLDERGRPLPKGRQGQSHDGMQGLDPRAEADKGRGTGPG